MANLGTVCADLAASCFSGSAGIAAGDLRARMASANVAEHSRHGDGRRDRYIADAIASFEAAPEMKAITGAMHGFRA